MKTKSNILILLLLPALVAMGQERDTTLKKLIENNLIEQNQIKEYKQLLLKNAAKSNSAYLYSLFQIEYKKLTGTSYTNGWITFILSDERPTYNEQVRINTALIQYLTNLKSCGLISEHQCKSFQVKINNGKFVDLLNLLLNITEETTLKEHMNSAKLKLFAKRLEETGIVTDQFNQLMIDIEQDKLQMPIEFLNYCNTAVIINEQDYPNDPDKYIEQIHRKTSTAIPELRFTNFEYQITIDSTTSYSDSKFYNLIVSFKSNGQVYKHKTNYTFSSPIQNEYQGNKIDQYQYYKIFNKVLADLQSPYRLHKIESHQIGATSNVYGIIALTKEQADQLRGGGAYLRPSYELYWNTLTTTRIEQAIEKYSEIGLLNRLTIEQIEYGKRKVFEQTNNNLNDVLSAFPNIVYMFDTELGNLNQPYAELTRAFKEISRNEFNATEISDNFDITKKKKVDLKLKIGNKTYKKVLKIDGDWIDSEYFSFIESVVTDQKLQGQFYQLYTGSQEVSVIYLTKQQYNFLRANRLLVFGDDWQTQEE